MLKQTEFQDVDTIICWCACEILLPILVTYVYKNISRMRAEE